ILRRSGLLDKATAPWWAAAILFLDLVLPGDIFAQREHIAAVLVLPVLATYLAALARKPAPLRFQVVAGLAGGVCVAIKPYFGIALALPLIYVLSASQGGLW